MKHWQMIPIFALTEKARISAAARFLTQQHWSVPRHVILWQKMLVTMRVTFPLTVLTIGGILRQARYIPAVLKQTCQRLTQVVQVWSEKSFLSRTAQPRTGCKYIWESLVWNWIISCTFTSKYCGTLMNHPGLWFLASSIGLSQDMWHCGTRCL